MNALHQCQTKLYKAHYVKKQYLVIPPVLQELERLSLGLDLHGLHPCHLLDLLQVLYVCLAQGNPVPSVQPLHICNTASLLLVWVVVVVGV